MGSNPTLSAIAARRSRRASGALLLPVLLILLPACDRTPAPPAGTAGAGSAVPAAAPTLADDLGALQKVRDAYVEAHNAGDIDRLMSLWAEDAVFMPMDEPTIFGREAIRRHIETILDQVPARVALSLEETRVLGDWAFDRGIETVTMATEASGREVTLRVKYICILQRQRDGSWKFARYIYNLDESPPEPA